MSPNRVRHLKKGDLVVLWRADSKKRQTGKVLEVNNTKGMIRVDGIGMAKRHTKPTQTSPKGGIVEKLRWWPASKFRVCDDAGNPLGRVGFKGKDEKKERTFSKSK
jgi:large subunit ribosomal protein L24